MRPLAIRVGAAALGAGVFGALVLAAPAVPAAAAGPAALVSDPAALVDPFIGTAGGFNTFPGPDVPFGMIQWSPETENRHDGGGYDHGDTNFRGFALTHISGPGCGGYGDIPILPLTGGAPSGDPNKHLEPISHSGEQASPGYYATTHGNGTRTELTSTTRTGTARITYPSGNQGSILIKLKDSQNGDSTTTAQVVSPTEVTGSATSGHFCGAGDEYTVFFDLVFDHPATSSKVIPASGPNPQGIFASFGNVGQLQARIGISFVSVAGARANLAAENASFNFDGVRTAARAAWSAMLNKIQIGGGTTSQQRVFYTGMYHALLHPNVVSDASGQYTGFDGGVHTVSGGQQAQYGTYSGWDIYRTQAQLSALLAPQQMSDSATSMLNDAAQNGGQLPKWATVGGESYVMVGDPGTAILTDYYAFGARGFNPSQAWQVTLAEANNQNNIRPGLNLEKQYGYIPENATNQGCCNFYGSVGTLLEYGIADAALSRFAAATGHTSDSDALIARAQNWRNVLNPANKFLSPRNTNGSFIPVAATDFGPGYVEGTAAQYRFLVPFNQKGLAAALGGNGPTNALLDHFLSKVDPNDDDTAAMHNEVDLGMQYFYDWTGQPAKTQEAAHRVRMMFHDNPDTMGDNDDLGAMSASIVWQDLGLYPVTPGSGDLAFSSPLFPQAVVHLASGNTITINAPGASETNFYVQSQNVNGSPSTRLYLPAAALSTGATLDYVMGSSPSTWGSGPADAPPSYDGAGGGPPPPPPGGGTGPVTGIAGKCVAAGGTGSGSPIVLTTCGGSAQQTWTVGSDGTLQALGMCLDVTGSGTANLTKVQLWDCNGTGAQSWQAAGGELVNTNSGKCLDDPGSKTTDGTQLIIYTCKGSANQLWHLPT